MIQENLLRKIPERNKLFYFTLTVLLTTICCAQDSLYLIGTITGESNAKRIIDVKGIGDINGDGYDDFMVSIGQREVALYLGSVNLDLTADVVFHYPGKETLNSLGGCAGIGDVNGDGYNDFLLGGQFYWGGSKGVVYLYFGGEHIDTIPAQSFYEPWSIQDYFGDVMTGVGDINNDGYDDFMISSYYNWTNGKGRVYLFWGGDTISTGGSLTFIDTAAINKPIDSFFGLSTANIGDLNNDGFDDIALSAGYEPGISERVYVYYGGSAMDTIPDTILTSNNSEYDFGRIIKNAGDLNKDGVNEFFIAGGENVYLYLKNDSVFAINGSMYGIGGYVNVESNCDINNDGYGDFIIGNTNYTNADSLWVGGAFVYLWDNISNISYKFRFEGETRGSEFSKIMSTMDINGDGYDELFIMAPSYPNFEIPSGKICIYSYKKITDGVEYKENLPKLFELYQNYPNPFNSITTINYELHTADHIRLKVYDVLGREIQTLVDEVQRAGANMIHFDGSHLSSGVYFYRLQTTTGTLLKKMILLR